MEATSLKRVQVSIGRYKDTKEKVVILELTEENDEKTFLTMEADTASGFANTIKEAALEIIETRQLQ